jgi:ATP-dependent RNA helicase DDX24/MAK5
LRALHHKGFDAPTPIQAAALPVALKGKDVIGVAQTVSRIDAYMVLILIALHQGSGKTLAYGLPILHHLLSQPRPAKNKRRKLSALILAPTRELALQVSSHLNVCLNKVEDIVNDDAPDGSKGKKKRKGKEKAKPEGSDAGQKKKSSPHVSVATIVGGMSSQKQRRVLERGVDVLVATPGRLWDILEDVSIATYLNPLSDLLSGTE